MGEHLPRNFEIKCNRENPEMKSDEKCRNCKSEEQLINGSFIMKSYQQHALPLILHKCSSKYQLI